MAEVGDKFIIEIDKEFKAKGIYKAYGGEENEYEEKLYRIKGFKTLVFNEYELAALEKYEPRAKEDFKFGDLVEILEGKYRGQRFYVTNSLGLQVDGIDSHGHTYRIEKFKLYNTGLRKDNFLNPEMI